MGCDLADCEKGTEHDDSIIVACFLERRTEGGTRIGVTAHGRTHAAATQSTLQLLGARAARLGVVLRRGPSAWAQLARWERDGDRVTPGQWFHGRVYERRCDLSPDGRLFVYFAAKHGRRPDPDRSRGPPQR